MNPTCKDVNRSCEFGLPFEVNSDIIEETKDVVTGRIMSDDITTRVKTGKYYRIVESKKLCKWCGNDETLSSDRRYLKG